MIKYEMYKIFKRKLVLIAGSVIIALIIVSNLSYIKSYVFDSEFHDRLQYELNVFEKNKGVLTSDKLNEFAEKYNFSKYDQMYYYYSSDGNAISVEKLFSKLNFCINFGYFWEWYSCIDDFAKYMKEIAIFIAVAFSGIFAYEKMSGMQEIILSSKYGRKKSVIARIKSAFILTNSLYLLTTFVCICTLYIMTKWAGADTSIQMAKWLWGSTLNMSWSVLLAHTILIGFMGVNFILLITLIIGYLANSPMVAASISIAVLFFVQPDIVNVTLSNDIVSSVVAVLPLNIFDTNNLAARISITFFGYELQYLYFSEILYVVLLIISFVILIKLVVKKQTYYAG